MRSSPSRSWIQCTSPMRPYTPRPTTIQCPCGQDFAPARFGRTPTFCPPCRERRSSESTKLSAQRVKEERGEAHLAYMRQKTHEWRERNPEHKSSRTPEQRRASKLRSKFGITIETYDQMSEAQNGVCAICKRSCRSGRRLAVDHCHRTGAIRGLLCKACNTALGFLEDQPELLDRAKEYLRQHSEVRDAPIRKRRVDRVQPAA